MSIDKYIASSILIVCHAFAPTWSSMYGVWDEGHFLYVFSHANIFHLAVNLFAIALLRNKIRWLPCYVIAAICSCLPCTSHPVVGCSGLLFAHVGYTWGRVGQSEGLVTRALLPALLLGLLPNMAMMLHIYCLIGGYLYGLLLMKWQNRRTLTD